MSGASGVDVTLTACTTVAFSTLLLLIENKIWRPLGGALLFTALGLGFLTKGPIALVLVGFPICFWMFFAKDYSLFRKVPWFLGALIFFTVTAPWFITAEETNHGFLEYFFVNENFKRFLYKDYGDKYGTGHAYPFGTVWIMFCAGFLPWTFPLLEVVARKRAEIFSVEPFGAK